MRRSRGQPAKTYRSTPGGVKSLPARVAARGADPQGATCAAARADSTQASSRSQTGVSRAPRPTVPRTRAPVAAGTAGTTAPS
jgi:hypothetical protein